MKIESDIYFIEGENRGKFPYSNSLLVNNILIDAGLGIEKVKEFSRKVDLLILSHTHPDHSSGAWIFNELGKKVLSPEGFATDLDSLSIRFVGESLSGAWKKFFTGLGMRSFKSEWYSDGEVLNKSPEIIAYKLEGHTKDLHIFTIDSNIMYGADIDLTSFGPWYGHKESDIEKFKKSIEKILEFDIDIFISSHRKPIFGRDKIEEEILKYLEVFDKRDQILIKLLTEPRSIEELVKISPFYGKKPFAKEILDYFEKMMIEKHLERLVKKGKVLRLNDEFIVR